MKNVIEIEISLVENEWSSICTPSVSSEQWANKYNETRNLNCSFKWNFLSHNNFHFPPFSFVLPSSMINSFIPLRWYSFEWDYTSISIGSGDKTVNRQRVELLGVKNGCSRVKNFQFTAKSCKAQLILHSILVIRDSLVLPLFVDEE